MMCNHLLNMSTNNDILQECLLSPVGFAIMASYTITLFFILLPLFLFVIYLGFQQSLHQHPAKFMSHSDVFTFNMIIIELINVFGSIIICVGTYIYNLQMVTLGSYIFFFNFHGQMFFHLLICLERYLAVVHPITYLTLRKEKGIKIRNILVVCVWVMCFASLSIANLKKDSEEILINVVVLPTLITVVFCSLNILMVLIRPHPGNRHCQKVDKSKMISFCIIFVIMFVLLLRFGWDIFSFRLTCVYKFQWEQLCIILISTVWTSIPSSMALPLIFLYRARKLLWCKKN